MVIGLSPSAEAYLKPSVQATWELPKPKSDLLSINGVVTTITSPPFASHLATAQE